MTEFGDCTFCGGVVAERRIEYDYRRLGQLLVISNVPAGVCGQCGEKYFQPGVVKRMDAMYHDISDHHRAPERILEVPWCRSSGRWHDGSSTGLLRRRW